MSPTSAASESDAESAPIDSEDIMNSDHELESMSDGSMEESDMDDEDASESNEPTDKSGKVAVFLLCRSYAVV